MFQTILNTIIAVGGVFGTIFMLFYAYWYLYTIVSIIKKPKKAPTASKQNEYGYIICARNEELVIADLVKSILAQNYPADKMHVFVMADNCTDNTAEAAREAGATVYERFNKEKVGKGYAMQELFEHLKTNEDAAKCKGYFVFDADNILHPDYTGAMNDTIENGARIAMGLRNTKNWDSNGLSACNGIYFLRDSLQMNRSRSIIGTSAMVTGTGWYVEKSIIDAEDGWKCTMMCEDSQFSISQILKGEKIVFCEDAEFYDEQVTTWKQSVKQRSRWIKGSTDIANKYGKQIFKYMFSKKITLRKLLTGIDCICLFFGAGYVATAGSITCLASMIALMLTLAPSPAMWFIPLSFVFSLYMNFFFSATLPVLFNLKKIYLPTGKKIQAILLFPLFMISYMFLSVRVVLLRQKVTWEPIVHKESFDMSKLKQNADTPNKKAV